MLNGTTGAGVALGCNQREASCVSAFPYPPVKPFVMNLRSVLAASLLASILWLPLRADQPAVKAVELFNGRDLSGWTVFNDLTRGDGIGTWTVRDGVIVCLGKPRGFLRTNVNHANYRLRLQWRWPEKPGNSGVFLHGSGPDKIWPQCYEAQLAAGNAGELRANGGALFQATSTAQDKSRPKLADSSERVPGEWNDYEIVCRGGSITLFVNGVRQNQLADTTLTSGWIGLQSEGGVIEFRAITLEPL